MLETLGTFSNGRHCQRICGQWVWCGGLARHVGAPARLGCSGELQRERGESMPPFPYIPPRQLDLLKNRTPVPLNGGTIRWLSARTRHERPLQEDALTEFPPNDFIGARARRL